jgi:hypothetical protein
VYQHGRLRFEQYPQVGKALSQPFFRVLQVLQTSAARLDSGCVMLQKHGIRSGNWNQKAAVPVAKY